MTQKLKEDLKKVKKKGKKGLETHNKGEFEEDSDDHKPLNIWESLHRKELKGKLMFRNNSQVILSKEECEAAYRLAAALTNHD